MAREESECAEAKLKIGGTLGAGPKVTSAELSAFEQAVRTPMPTRAVPRLRFC